MKPPVTVHLPSIVAVITELLNMRAEQIWRKLRSSSPDHCYRLYRHVASLEAARSACIIVENVL